MDETTLLTAGRFAVLTGLSAKALRLYAENGLLTPADLDPVTGYRRYEREQVTRARLIGLLRAAGMGLRDIALLSRSDDAAALRIIDAYEASLSRQVVAGSLVLAQARTHFREDTLMTDLTTTVVTDQPVLSLLRRLHVSEIDRVIAASVATLRERAERSSWRRPAIRSGSSTPRSTTTTTARSRSACPSTTWPRRGPKRRRPTPTSGACGCRAAGS